MTAPAAPPSRTALVTGANKGLGRETARRLAALGWTVWLGSRDLDHGRRAAEELSAEQDADVRAVQLDVTDDASVAAAVSAITETGLDVLVNNAGVAGSFYDEAFSVADFDPVLATNLVGAVRVTEAFTPLLRASAAPVIVNVSSELGSIGLATEAGSRYAAMTDLVYSASKAALNMITVRYAARLPEARVNAVTPGFTATDLNGFRGTRTVEEGADAIVAAATVAADGPTATFTDADGPLPW